VNSRLKVLHLSPTYFSPDSVVGGGERYACELAKAMTSYADVTLLSFGKEEKNYFDQNLNIKIKKPLFYIKNNILNPFYLNLYKDFKNADVIHVHQIFNFLAEICIIWAKILGKPIYLTDHGGGGTTYFTRFGITHLANGLLTVSEFSSQKLKHIHPTRFPIYGGVNPQDYLPHSAINKNKDTIITIGRILPHKGHHHLIEAISDHHLTIIGQVADPVYFQFLLNLAKNKKVKFLHHLSDNELKNELARASLAVFPSTQRGINNELLSGEPELLGIAPLETMAMNIPTIVSDVGAYPEICFDQKYFMFENGNIFALKELISYLLANEALRNSNFSEHVREKFTWDAAAIKCLEYYNT
jgi:glycosyltransferase involved in cell wall biosynthesis